MPAMVMSHDVDPRRALAEALGNLDDIDIFNNQVLVAVYQRSEKTAKGIFLPDQHRSEDRFQSKVGMIVKMGEAAFKDDTGHWFRGVEFSVGDWIVYRVSEGWSLEIKPLDGVKKSVLCRLLDDTSIRARITHPDLVW